MNQELSKINLSNLRGRKFKNITDKIKHKEGVSLKEISIKIGTFPNKMASMRRGTSPVTREVLINLITSYPYALKFIKDTCVDEHCFSYPIGNEYDQRTLIETILKLKRIVETQRKTIVLLEKNNDYSKEREHTQKRIEYLNSLIHKIAKPSDDTIKQIAWTMRMIEKQQKELTEIKSRIRETEKPSLTQRIKEFFTFNKTIQA